MSRRNAGLSAVIAVLLATVWLVDASAATVKPDSCPTNKQKVVDTDVMYENLADFGTDGHVWALDAAHHYIQIWRVGGNAYCMKIHGVGTFTTFAAVSPEGTGTVPAGATGTFAYTIYVNLFGKFGPTIPTTGSLDTVDFQCQQDGSCAGDPTDFTYNYFPSLLSYHYGAYLLICLRRWCLRHDAPVEQRRHRRHRLLRRAATGTRESPAVGPGRRAGCLGCRSGARSCLSARRQGCRCTHRVRSGVVSRERIENPLTRRVAARAGRPHLCRHTGR
jgi:hypothetical protein